MTREEILNINDLSELTEKLHWVTYQLKYTPAITYKDYLEEMYRLGNLKRAIRKQISKHS